MLAEEKQMLWRTCAVALGMALPAILIGKAVMFALLVLGVLTGLAATKGESLRATVKLMLNSWFTLLGVALMAALLVGVWLGIDPAFAFDKWLQVVVVVVFTGALFMTLREMPGRHLEDLLRVLAIATTVVAALGLVDALAGDVRLATALHGADKATTPYRLNALSSALAVLLPFVWARLFLKAREGEPFAQRIAVPATAFGVVAALVCGGRSGWVGLAVAALVFVFLASRYHRMVMHARHYGVALLTLALGLLLYGVAFGWDFMWDRLSIVGEAGVGRGMMSGRPEVWGVALGHMLDAPAFGIGMMNYRNLPGAVDLHPHNWLLQLLLEGGLVSTALFVALMGLLVWRFFHFAKGNIYGVAATASVLAFLTSGLANTSIFNLWWLGYLMFVCVLGWRAGWGGPDLKVRRRGRVVA
ncbi:MAG: hypothetical protein GC129_06595 [Proteobacteria bacterium]|nr:hypothetical protein [Pseudomonadota bacterium]